MGIGKADIQAMKARVQQVGQSCTTEDSIKTGLVLPFLQKLGWDIFSPTEVVPQYMGMGQSEAIDFAIKQDGVLLYVIKCVAVKGTDLRKIQLLVRKYLKGEGISLGIVTNGVQYLLCNAGCENINLMIDLTRAEETLELIQLISKEGYTPSDLDAFFRDSTHRVYIKQFKEQLLRCPNDEMMSLLYSTFTASVPEAKINKQRFKQLWTSSGAVIEAQWEEEEKAAEVKGVLEKVIMPKKGTTAGKSVSEPDGEHIMALEKVITPKKGTTVGKRVSESDDIPVTALIKNDDKVRAEGKKASKGTDIKREVKKQGTKGEKDVVVVDNTAWRTAVVANVAIPALLECDLVMEQFSGNVTYYTKDSKFILHKGAVLREVGNADEYRKLYPVQKYAPDYILNKDVTFRTATDVVAYMSGRRVQGYTWLRIKDTELSLEAYLRGKAVELGYLSNN